MNLHGVVKLKPALQLSLMLCQKAMGVYGWLDALSDSLLLVPLVLPLGDWIMRGRERGGERASMYGTVRISQPDINLSPMLSLSASSTLTQITESLFRRSLPSLRCRHCP